MTQTLSRRRRDLIGSRIQTGATNAEIAAELGVPAALVRDERRARASLAERNNALVARYQSGAALRQIVHESGLSLTTVRQIIVRAGVLRAAQPLEQAVIQMQLRARIQEGWPDDRLCAVYHVTAERVRWLRVAFERMQERDATIIALYRSGMKHREVGAQLGLPVGLISNVISAAGASQGRGGRGRTPGASAPSRVPEDGKRDRAMERPGPQAMTIAWTPEQAGSMVTPTHTDHMASLAVQLTHPSTI